MIVPDPLFRTWLLALFIAVLGLLCLSLIGLALLLRELRRAVRAQAERLEASERGLAARIRDIQKRGGL